MCDERDIEDVSKYLKAAGLLVVPVDVDPKSSSERCDLSAYDTYEKYLIEVKGINDEDEIKQALRHRELDEKDRSHVYRKRVDKEIHKATSQLQSTAND